MESIQMLYYFVAMVLVLLRASADNGMKCQDICNGVVYRGKYYDKVKLFEGVRKPTNMLMHKYSRNLFFSHTITNGNTNDFSIMSCHIENRKCLNISKVPGGHAIAFERWSNLIYFGGSDGIYTYKVKCGELKFFAEKGKSIWGLDIKRNIFYIEYPTKQVFNLFYGRYSKDPNFVNVEVDGFFVSSNLDIYFYNKTALYSYVLDSQKRNTKILNDKINVTQITGDIYGDIFFSANDGVYMHAVGMSELTKIANIDNVYGVAFAGIITSRGESYQLIYSDENSVNMLVPSDNEELCHSEEGVCFEGAVGMNTTTAKKAVGSIPKRDIPLYDPEVVIPSTGVICER